MHIIQYSKWFAGAGQSSLENAKRLNEEDGESYRSSTANSVIQPAIINLDGIRLHSDTPTTAKQAADINERVKQWAEASQTA